MFRLLTLILGLTLVAACTPVSDTDPLVDLGDFSLGHNVVVAGKAQQGPISRDATPEEWVTVLTEAVDRRLGQYQGEKLYHVAVSVEGFMLAPAGVPLLFKPKSALIVNVTVWDDAAGVKLNDKVEQFTIFETTTGESAIVGSGHDRTREEQMQMLARNAVHEIEEWLVAQRSAQGWFGGAPTCRPMARKPRPRPGIWSPPVRSKPRHRPPIPPPHRPRRPARRCRHGRNRQQTADLAGTIRLIFAAEQNKPRAQSNSRVRRIHFNTKGA